MGAKTRQEGQSTNLTTREKPEVVRRGLSAGLLWIYCAAGTPLCRKNAQINEKKHHRYRELHKGNSRIRD